MKGLVQVPLVQGVNQVCNHLRIGLTLKHIAFDLEIVSQGLKVLDDAVVHQANLKLPLHTEMGMGIVHMRRAMRGPPGVRNPEEPLQSIARLGGKHLFGQLTDP